jgi:hypothetical protein
VCNSLNTVLNKEGGKKKKKERKKERKKKKEKKKFRVRIVGKNETHVSCTAHTVHHI